jgi:hypothetical protein
VPARTDWPRLGIITLVSTVQASGERQSSGDPSDPNDDALQTIPIYHRRNRGDDQQLTCFQTGSMQFLAVERAWLPVMGDGDGVAEVKSVMELCQHYHLAAPRLPTLPGDAALKQQAEVNQRRDHCIKVPAPRVSSSRRPSPEAPITRQTRQ